MEQHLGGAYAHVWAGQQVLADLGERTPIDALDAGVAPKVVWRAVWASLGLPASER